jgi:ABC-type nitrate/sulfonate/bicarbonate transport system substrate-binding protein
MSKLSRMLAKRPRCRQVAVSVPAVPAALKAHRIDAGYEAEPYLSEAEVQAGAGSVIDVNDGASPT